MPRQPASSSTPVPNYSLANTRESYRDLLIFEERLKQNSARLAVQRKKYEAFLFSLVLSIALLAYRVFVVPSCYTSLQFLTSGLLLIGIVTLILFFATGVYSEKIAYAYKFVPQANRALRYFNIYLNTKQTPRSWFFNPVASFRKSSPTPTSFLTNPGSQLARASSAPSYRSGSSSPRQSKSNAFPSRSRSPPAIRSQSIPLAPIPPSNNPRGELIFSSKVSPGFREGYERYRSEWERKRKPSKSEMSWGTHWASFLIGKRYKGNNTPTQSSSLSSSAKGEKSSEKLMQRGRANVYIASLDLSDSSSTASAPNGPSLSASLRGRDVQSRPLSRTGSSSSLSSSISNSPPPSRRSSPLRRPLSSTSLHEAGHSPNPSSHLSTPELIREEDEYFDLKDEGGNYSSLASPRFNNSSDSSLASGFRSGPGSPVADRLVNQRRTSGTLLKTESKEEKERKKPTKVNTFSNLWPEVSEEAETL